MGTTDTVRQGILDALPLNSSNKELKFELRDQGVASLQQR